MRPDGKLPWRDTDLQIEGPVVAEFQKLFMETWEKQKGEPLAPRNYFPGAGHAGQGGRARHRQLARRALQPDLRHADLGHLRSAETEIWITNAYFVPDPQLLAALKEAVARGVDVRLVLPSSTDSWLVFHAGRANYTELLKAGVKIYERREALLHVKAAVIDGVWSTVGSTNLDWRSFLHNEEVNAVVLGTGFGDRMRAAFLADLAKSDEVTLEEMEAAPGRRARQGADRPDVGVLAVTALAGCALALLCIVWLASPPREAQDAAALKARHADLRRQLASNQFGSPSTWNPATSPGELQRRRLRDRRLPFAVAGPALQDMDYWCDILILHQNVKSCRASRPPAGDTLSLNIGRKHDQPLADAYPLEFLFRVAAAGPEYLQVTLNADEGPMGTSRYRIDARGGGTRRRAQLRAPVLLLRLRHGSPHGHAGLPGDDRARQGGLHHRRQKAGRRARVQGRHPGRRGTQHDALLPGHRGLPGGALGTAGGAARDAAVRAGTRASNATRSSCTNSSGTSTWP